MMFWRMYPLVTRNASRKVSSLAPASYFMRVASFRDNDPWLTPDRE
jgi:hypothetical protein